MVEDKKSISKKPETVTGLPENTVSALCYVLGWITGLIFLLVEPTNKKVKFHAIQSLVIFGALGAIMWVPLIKGMAFIVSFILWISLIIKTYNGEKLEIPFVSDWVRSQVK